MRTKDQNIQRISWHFLIGLRKMLKQKWNIRFLNLSKSQIFLSMRNSSRIQCSPISCELLRERSNGYRSLGIQVLWLLGEKLWLKERLTKLQRDFLYFSHNMGFYLWELDHKRQVLRLKYLLHQDLKGKLHYQLKEFFLWQRKISQKFTQSL